MLITPVQVRNAIGLRQSWFHARFGHLVKDYLISNVSQYDIDACIAWAEQYQSNTRNPKQRVISTSKVEKCLTYMKGLRDGNND